jgi:HEAT repeat protein
LESRSAAEKLAAATVFPLLATIEPGDGQKLVALFRDPSSRVRKAAVETAGECGPKVKAAVPDVVKLVRDSDSDVALAAIVALGRMGQADAAVVSALRQAALKNPAQARAAVTSLRRLGLTDDLPRDPDPRPKRKGMN